MPTRDNTIRWSSSSVRTGASVIAEVLLIAIVVILATVVLAFTSGQVMDAMNNPSISILIEDAEAGASNITLVHIGGDSVRDAFAPSAQPSCFVNATIFGSIEVRINGSIYEGWASLNTQGIAKPDFEVGDELELGLGSDRTLSHGDSITVVYVPTSQVVGWWIVK
jgi:hypothetical protein